MFMRVIIISVLLLFTQFAQAGRSTEQVNINTADAPTLDRLLIGVGPAKAEAIVQHRKEYGRFKRLEDLEKVKGIGPKLLEKNRDQIRI